MQKAVQNLELIVQFLYVLYDKACLKRKVLSSQVDVIF